VGKVAAYASAINALNATPNSLAAQHNAAQALANAANKGITSSTVTGLNALLGLSLTAPNTPDSLATAAAALQK
jgi:hypothetical protein